MSSTSTSGESDAGPSVQMILALRIATAAGWHDPSDVGKDVVLDPRIGVRQNRFMLSRDSHGRALVAGRLLTDILVEAGAETPAYVYDLGAMAREARELILAFGDQPQLVAYAVKANSAGAVIRTLGAAGCGAEVGSGAELELALRAGIEPARLLLSGMGKSALSIDAALMAGDRGILAIQVDSVDELARIASRARTLGRPGRVALRLNPGVMAETHEAIATGHDDAKFGIAMRDLDAAFEALDREGAALQLVGIGGHVGSQLVRTDDYLEGARAVLGVAVTRPGLELVDFGGGFGIDYGDGCAVRPADFARAASKLAREALPGVTLVVEPGRSLVGPHGILVASQVASKQSRARRWLVLDTGMTDLLRPALYGARHRIEALLAAPEPNALSWRVVGPVCESTDDFGEFALGEPPPRQVVIRDAGAYGYTMASHYNGRGYPTEVFVHEDGRVTTSRANSATSWVDARSAT